MTALRFMAVIAVMSACDYGVRRIDSTWVKDTEPSCYNTALVVRTSRPAALSAEQSSRRDARRPWAEGVSGDKQAAALELYDAGNDEFIQAHYSQALAKYQDAIKLWDHPAIRFNMAVCLVKLDQLVDARNNLERSLIYGEAPLSASAYTQGLTYRQVLDAQLAQLTIACAEPDEEVVIDGKLVFRGPGVAAMFVLPGEHLLVATKPGFLPASKKLVLVAGQPMSCEVRPIIDPRSKP
jgi:tetratricopeptide (TPR) repeat protein